MQRPLLLLTVLLASGCWAGVGLPRGAAAALLALAAALLGLSLAASHPGWAGTALAGAGLGIGAAAAAVESAGHEAAPLLPWVEQACGAAPAQLEGFAAGDARQAGDRWLIQLDVASARCGASLAAVSGRVRVDVGGQSERAEVLDGDRLALWTTLRRPRGLGNPESPDAAGQALRRSVHAYGLAKSPRLVSVLERGALRGPRAWTAAVRAWARRELAARLPPGAEEGLVRAMVLGDRGGLDPEDEEAFRAAGTYHVLAISGAQVALLAALLLWPLRRLCAPRWWSTLLVSVLLLLYAQLVGGEVPVVRATCMALVVLIGLALDLAADLANLLGLAAGLLLVHRPSTIGDVAFQLSFGATLGILLLTPALLESAPRLPLRLDMAVAASLAAQVALAPLLAQHFARLAPAALVLNLAAVPLSGAILLAGLTTLLLAAVAEPLASLAANTAWIAAHALLRTGDLVGAWPALDIRVAPPAAWVWALHLGGLWAFLDPRRRRRAAVLLALAFAGLVHGPAGAAGDGRLHLTALDVGQGDALVVRTPEGRVMVVDTGGSRARGFDAGASVVAPHLWRLGVRRLDRLVLSHAHPDHVGGLRFVLRAFQVGEVWEGPAPIRDATYAEMDQALRTAGVARRTVTAGVSELWDGIALDVLGPPSPARPPWRTRNDDSIVLLLRHGQLRMLLSGDIEAAGEGRLAPGSCQVVKVPHHGSRTSSTLRFVSAAAPRLAIVSAGFRNPFGHPHPEVVERYLRSGALVLRTDRDGAVSVSSDGRRLWLTSHRTGSTTLR